MSAEIKQTTLCYLEKDGKYLMLYRNKKKADANEGKWIAVGGKFEKGESPEECMKREVFEETGLEVKRYRYAGVVTFLSDTWPTEMMHLFVCNEFAGNEITCSEGELRWVLKEDVPKLPMWEGDRLFLKLLVDEEPFFSLKLRYEGESLVEAKLNGECLVENKLPAKIYQHFKGGLYRILGEAFDSESGEATIIYQALYGEKKIWVRPKKMFFENVGRDGKIFPRFKLLEK